MPKRDKTDSGENSLDPAEVERRKLALRYRVTVESTREAIGTAADDILSDSVPEHALHSRDRKGLR